MSIARLTERKLRDARFRKNEEALFRAFFEEEVEMKLSMGELARKIGVNRVTIYRHHRMPREIMGDYERHILEKYVELMVEIRKREGVELRRMYYEVILFILQNRRIFEMLMERKNFKVLEGMIVMLKPEIMDFIKLSGDYERIFRVYMGEIVGLIVNWELDGFQEVEIMKLLNNMMYLTKSARQRLLPLVN